MADDAHDLVGNPGSIQITCCNTGCNPDGRNVDSLPSLMRYKRLYIQHEVQLISSHFDSHRDNEGFILMLRPCS